MKISIITPTWNSIKTIERNVKSIQCQSHKDIEHIIIDNLSTDGTVNFVKQHREIKLISEKDRGISDAFNKGISIASGDIIGIINSDDCLFSEDSLKRVNEIFTSTNCDIVHGDMLFIDETFGSNIRKPLQCSIKKAFPFNHPSFFVKKNVYERFGSFDMSYKLAMDFDFVSRFYIDQNHQSLSIKYLSSPPLTKMYAGGISWSHESKAIDECRVILKKSGYWDTSARFYYYTRKFRIWLKPLLSKLGLDQLVVIWRKIKWGHGS